VRDLRSIKGISTLQILACSIFYKYYDLVESWMHSISDLQEKILDKSKKREALVDYLEKDVHRFSKKLLTFITASTFAYVPALVTTHEKPSPPIAILKYEKRKKFLTVFMPFLMMHCWLLMSNVLLSSRSIRKGLVLDCFIGWDIQVVDLVNMGRELSLLLTLR
jgi:hypothetical protein